MQEEVMKVLIVFSLCIGVALALACKNLAELEACNKPEGDCSCQAGLSCVPTKKIISDGKVTFVKQCMPEDEPIIFESIYFDKEKRAGHALRAKRGFGIITECSSEAECARNFCCPPYTKLCLQKILENMACNLDDLYQCGCQEGLVCKKTADIIILPGVTGWSLNRRSHEGLNCFLSLHWRCSCFAEASRSCFES
ncbi:uncharacterized protein LOC144629202 isoform X1 [Oculina patagonica]